MRKHAWAALMTSLALIGTSVGAQEPAPAPDAAKSEKKVCRTSKMTGSLTRSTRICMTAAEWRELNNRTRRGVDEMTSVASGGKECILDERGGCR